MERGQAVHELRAAGCRCAVIAAALTWYGVRSLTRSSQTSFGSPIDTHTSVWTKSTPLHALRESSVRVMRAPDASATLLAASDHVLARPQVLGRQIRTSEPMIAPITSSERAHVEAAVAHEAVADLVERLAVGVLGHGEEVGEHLGGVPLVGQAVVDRHVGVLGQLLHGRLRLAAELDRVEHPRQHPGGVGGRLLVPDLRGRRVEVGDVRALVVRPPTSNAQRVRVEVFSKISAMFLPRIRGTSVPAYFARLRSRARSSRNCSSSVGEVELLEEVRLRRLNGIGVSSHWKDDERQDTASRSIGQLMHRGPPRPRPSSDPVMVTISIPLRRRNVLVVVFRS